MSKQIVVAALILLSSVSLCLSQGAEGKLRNPPPVQKEEETRLTIVMSQASGASVPPILMGALEPIDLPAEKNSWAVQIVTRGGILGGGKGDIKITSDGSVSCSPAISPCGDRLSAEALQSLAQMVISAKPSEWGGSAIGVCRDCYVTILALHRRETDGVARAYIAYWDDSTQERIPEQVRRLSQNTVVLAAPER